MQLYCGIDLHSNNSLISVIDSNDRVIAEKRLDNKLELIHHYLSPYQDDIRGVVVESTFYSSPFIQTAPPEDDLTASSQTARPCSSRA